MPKVPCPVCGPAHDTRHLHDDLTEFSGKLKRFTRRHPDSTAAFTMLQLVNRMTASLETIMRQQVTAQRAVKGNCPVCHGFRELETNAWGEEVATSGRR